MALVALHSAATGLSALSTQIDVIANNLANVNTQAFKGSRANFEDLLYQELAQPGVENGSGLARPSGVEVGLGVAVSNTARDFKQGPAIDTGNPLDMMISGNGFFSVDIIKDEGNGIGYTRAGNFFVNKDGELVLGNAQGPRLEPTVSGIPTNATAINITADGQVLATVPGSATQQQVGQIQLANFINPQGLKALGGNIFSETQASGQPITGKPGENGIGTLQVGFIEGSNVDPVKELVELIKAQRAFEMNSQTIQAADQALQVVSNLRKF
jgi:flagellar basal-body rod protein FlgG